MAEPSFLYQLADELADFGTPQAKVDLMVRQTDRAVPSGIAARFLINL